MRRQILSVDKSGRTSILHLECGHNRSIGGHVFPNGSVVPARPELFADPFYDCRDGTCRFVSQPSGNHTHE